MNLENLEGNMAWVNSFKTQICERKGSVFPMIAQVKLNISIFQITSNHKYWFVYVHGWVQLIKARSAFHDLKTDLMISSAAEETFKQDVWQLAKTLQIKGECLLM